MAQATITARVDEHDKIDFDAFCANVGLNTSAFYVIYKPVFIIDTPAEFSLKIAC